MVFALWAISLVLFRAPTFGDALALFGALGFGNVANLNGFGMDLPELVFTVGLLPSYA